MLLPIPDLLTGADILRARQLLDQAEWVDGRVTAGHQSSLAKDNMQLPEGSGAARELGAMILSALEKNALFISAALPARVFPTLFNRYRAANHSVRMWTMPSERSRELPTEFGPIFRPTCSWRVRMSTTAANW
jgi:predicted 2-oxoglutarate/Fe(II)-dependent dioxygenase YbiX